MKSCIQQNITLAPLSYYKIGGTCQYFAAPQNLEELEEVSRFLLEKKIGYLILGAGSNVLIDDERIDGLVLHTAKLGDTLIRENNLVTAGTSVKVIQLLRLCMKEGLKGLEFLVGVPGNVGGITYMNAGTSLGEMSNLLEEVTVYNLFTKETVVYQKSELKYTYRKQHFLNPHDIILKIRFKVDFDEPKNVQDQIQSLLKKRKSTQPIDKPSCGSVFKNPKSKSAWQLVDSVGLRGKQIGQAQISPMHSNFIVNLGGAKATDVRSLINLAKKTVQEITLVELEEEVQFLGNHSLKNLSI